MLFEYTPREALFDPKSTAQVRVASVSSDSDSDGSLSQTQFALLVTHLQEELQVIEYPVPSLGDNDILVENRAIGLNPIDWKGKKYGFGIYHFPWINGRESSGIVVKKGDRAANFALGDKVIVSSTSYRDNRTSTFQQYTAIDSRLVWRLPESLSFENGATVGVGLVTAGVLFYDSFGWLLPTETPHQVGGTILIWGGATVVGIYVTQLAKIHGLRVVAIASPENEAYLKEYGADLVIDRYLLEHEISERALSFDSLISYGVDCISKETAASVVSILDKASIKGSKSPEFAAIVGLPKHIPGSVTVKPVTIKKFHEDIEFGSLFVKATTTAFKNGLLKPVRHRSYNGGLHSIDRALKDLERKGARGEKYVVSL